MPINQPSGSIKLTNVSLVRMKKGKKRFEIACYQNKVQDYRKGIEKDLDEVLQIPQVFVNVSKGQVANNDDLKAAFGSTDTDEIILQILKKGELQVGGKERQAQLDQVKAEISQLVASKCVNPRTKRPYTASIIEKVLTNELKYNVVATKPAKTQALDAIRLLIDKQVVPIARARMKIRVVAPAKDARKYSEKIKEFAEEVEDEQWDDEWELVMYIEPGSYRELEDAVRDAGKGKASVDLMETAVIQEGNQTL